MEIIKFKDKTWTEIPKQDNPTFDYKYDDPRLQEHIIGRRHHCLLICKVLPYEYKAVSNDGYVVIEIPITGDVIRRGLFWNFDNAELFASALVIVVELAAKKRYKNLEKHS